MLPFFLCSSHTWQPYGDAHNGKISSSHNARRDLLDDTMDTDFCQSDHTVSDENMHKDNIAIPLYRLTATLAQRRVNGEFLTAAGATMVMERRKKGNALHSHASY